MKTHKIIICLVILVLMFGVVVVGAVVHLPQKITNDRVNACELKGGRYSLFYSDYLEAYREDCEIKDTEIKDF